VTTPDETQRLRYAFYQCHDLRQGIAEEGVFIADDLESSDPEGFAGILRFCDRSRLPCLTRAEWIERRFYPEAWSLGAMVIGFQLPFQLSRLAVRASAGRGRAREAFSLWLSENPYRANLSIQPISPQAAFIQFLRPKRHRKATLRDPFEGRFLDLQTLSFALTGTPMSFQAAAKTFLPEEEAEASALLDSRTHRLARITPAALASARKGVGILFRLFVRLWEGYNAFEFATWEPESCQESQATPITRIFSPASLAKATFKKMGLSPPGGSPRAQGIAMAAFYGGRTEVALRKVLVPARLLDFTSQYPAVFTLLNLWPWMTAGRLEGVETDGEEVLRLLADEVRDPETLFDPAFWPNLAGYAEIVPQGDLLPVRAPFGKGSGSREGLLPVGLSLAPLESRTPLWFALPDLVASVLLTGKIPRILKSFKITPHTKPPSLKTVSLGPGVQLDPSDPKLFARLIEERKRLQERGEAALANGLKLIANTGCYGILVEFDPVCLSRKDASLRSVLYAGDHTFEKVWHGRIERAGSWACPVIGSLVTAGGRLLLALLQWEVERRGGAFVWCALDAACIVAAGAAPTTHPPAGIRPLTEKEFAAIQAAFQKLSPYDPARVPQFLKEEGRGDAFAIAPNRYCLRDGEAAFVKMTLHGLGGVLAPEAESLKAFGAELWAALLSGTSPPAWDQEPLRRLFPIRKPATWQRIRKEGRRGRGKGKKPYPQQIKPFNTLQSVQRQQLFGPKRNPGEVQQVFAPYPTTPMTRSALLRQRWWDREGNPYLLDLTGEVSPGPGLFPARTIRSFVEEEFALTEEVKRVDDSGQRCRTWTKGRLFPLPVVATGIYLIGKETDRVVVGDPADPRLEEEDPEILLRPTRQTRLESVALLGEFPPHRIAHLLGISERYWRQIRARQRRPGKALARRLQDLGALLHEVRLSGKGLGPSAQLEFLEAWQRNNNPFGIEKKGEEDGS